MRAALLALLLSSTAANAQVVVSETWENYCHATRDCYAGEVVPLNRPHSELARVNTAINRFTYRANPWGDWFDIREMGIGDCKNFAIAKRNALIALGWPRSNLLLAFPLNEAGVMNINHVVLLAYANGRWWVLDNMQPNVPAAIGTHFVEPQQGRQWRRITL